MAAFPVPAGSVIVVPGGPDNTLPGDQPGIDNSLPQRPGPVDPGFGIPLPPVTVWPTPPTAGQPLPLPPTYPVPPAQINNDLPRPPTMWPTPPVPPTTWPPPTPIRPDLPMYPTFPAPPYPPHVGGGPAPGAPPTAGQPLPGDQPIAGQPLPMPPGSVWPPLPPEVAGPVMCLVWIVGAGYRWTVIDPTLDAGMPLPSGPPGGVVDNELPPHAQPRR